MNKVVLITGATKNTGYATAKRFAKFLNKGSPVRLRILTSPTCVGLRYGRLFDIPATFLASVKSHASLLEFRSLFGSGCVSGVLHYQTPSLWKPS